MDNSPINIVYRTDIALVSCDRVIISFHGHEKVLRVTRVHDGEILKEEPFTHFDLDKFIAKVKEYDRICNHR